MTSKISTEDCKNFIQLNYKLVDIKQLKRKSKFKDANGNTVREFSHPSKEMPFYVIEDSHSELSLSEIKPEPYTQKKETISIFEQEDIDGIRKLLKTIGKEIDSNNDIDFDDMIERIKNSPHFKALPSQFTFNFPYDAYNNYDDNVKNGIETPFGEGDEGFCVRFYDKNKLELDYYWASVVVSYSPLDTWLDSSDEDHFIQSYDCPLSLTVKEAFQKLIDLGFDYSPKSTSYIEDDCLFQKELKKLLK